MAAISFRWSTLACCALGGAFVTVGCGGSGSSTEKGSAGTSAAAGASNSGAGATGGSGGASGSGSGATGGSSGGTGGASAGGTGGGSGGTSGTSGTMSSGAAAGTGGSSASGAGGTTGATGGTAGDAAGASAGGTAGTPTGGSAGKATGGDAGAATGGTGGIGGSGGPGGAVPSTGCGTTGTPEDGLQHIDVGGTMRDYIIRVPSGYDPNKPSRLIYAFHGMQGSADQVDTGAPPNQGLPSSGPYYSIQENADPDVIFVAGQALSGGWTNTGGRDIDYVKALVAHLEGELCIDQSRRFATGFSFGAIMTITVACNLSDMFRAVAPMSGSLQNGCPDGGQSIAYWASHGTMDTTIDISKGEEARDEFVKRNECDMTTVASTPDGCVAYNGCKDGYPVNWCPFDGIHQPPPFSGPAIWAFLSQF